MLTKETLSRPITPNLTDFKKIDILIQPNEGGRQEPNSFLDTLILARPDDRISSPAESQNTSFTEASIAPNLGENSRLKNTGWNSALEGRRLFKNYNQNLKVGKTSQEALVITAAETELNIRNFIREFVQSGVVLPDSKRIQKVNGVRRMVGDNGIPVVDCITARERLGAVLDATKKVDQFVSAPVQNIWKVGVINSPNDWNGITRDYLDNQTIVSWVDEFGVLHGATLVTDLNQEQSRQLSHSLGVAEELLNGKTEAERISNIVRNPALFSYAKSIKDPIEFVFEKILAIRGNSDIRLEQLDGSIEYRSVEEAKKDTKRLDQLLKFNQNCERYLLELKDFIFKQINSLDNWFSQHRIVAKIEEIILLITDDHLKDLSVPQKTYWVSSDYSVVTINTREDRFDRAVAFLETRAGCSQVTGSSRLSLRGISLGLSISNDGEIFGGFDQYGSLDFECPKCNRTNKRPRGQLLPNCQHCNADVTC